MRTAKNVILSVILILFYHTSELSGQEIDSSPYRDQSMDPPAGQGWLDSPFLWAGFVLLLLVLFLFLRRGKKPSRKFMEPLD